jgi:hypothetical protein
MGIETYGSMVKQILNEVHDADVCVVALIKHMMTPKPDRILRGYGQYQTLYGTVKGIEFQQGLPDLDNLDPREKHLIILDDLMDEADQRVASLFTKKSHHRNVSVMYIVQNLFHH